MTEPCVILIVDDDEPGRYAKVRLLRSAGYATLEAATGGQALEEVTAHKPDLVLLDVRLPDLNGVEVCRRIKATSDCAVVLQTAAALGASNARAEGLDSGADAYLSEPIESNELLATIRALMRLRDAERALRQLNLTLEQRVRERTQQLADANRHLVEEMQRREQAEMALRQSQKMEALGQLTGGVAHDFNNLLTVIRGNLELIDVAGANPEKLARYVEAAQQAVGRGERLTSQLLAFSRQHNVAAERIELGAVLREFEPMLRRAAGEKVELLFELSRDGCPVSVDVGQFEAAMLNLAVNARDAMPEGGRLAVSTAHATVGAGGAPRHPEAPPGEYCRVEVRDTGIGMAPEIAERVFEPFFTTKDIGKGTGLGLAQVYGFAKRSRGFVSIDTAPGRGTTVAILLPRAARENQAAADTAGGYVAPLNGTETVLVVEDDVNVREVVVAMLEDLGYRVLVAGNGREGLERLGREAEVDLLFSDIVMPGGLDGVELARRARETRPGLAVLLTSGFPRSAAVEEVGFPVLRKPYRRAELAQWLRRSLAARSGVGIGITT